MEDAGQVYADGRQRLSKVLTDIDAAEAARPVPCCPAWSVQDVTAHVVGVCADIAAGNLAGSGTDAWTAAQVEQRRDRSVAELVDEWSEVGPAIEALAQHFPGRTAMQLVADLTTHEHDILGALQRPDARDSEGVAIGLDFFMTVVFPSSLTARGLGPLEVVAGGRTWVAGSGGDGRSFPDQAAAGGVFDDEANRVLFGGEPATPAEPPVARLEAPAFELFRALTGRRSAAQIAGFDWSVDPAPYLPAFTSGPFTVSATDINE